MLRTRSAQEFMEVQMGDTVWWMMTLCTGFMMYSTVLAGFAPQPRRATMLGQFWALATAQAASSSAARERIASFRHLTQLLPRPN